MLCFLSWLCLYRKLEILRKIIDVVGSNPRNYFKNRSRWLYIFCSPQTIAKFWWNFSCAALYALLTSHSHFYPTYIYFSSYLTHKIHKFKKNFRRICCRSCVVPQYCIKETENYEYKWCDSVSVYRLGFWFY